MKRLVLALSLVVALASGACDDAVPTGPEADSFTFKRAGASVLGVMTWNIYVGADLTQLLGVEYDWQVPCAVNDVWEDVVSTDFAARAVAIADEIEAFGPRVIGLNEVSTFDFLLGTTDDLVFLSVLQDELTSRGLDYVVPIDESTLKPAVSTNFEVTLPIVYGECPALPDDYISYTEYDVILLRDDVTFTGADNDNFEEPLPLPLPGGGELSKYSGWAYVDIVHKELPYRVFTTHLEPADTGECETQSPELLFVHNAQATELVGVLNDEDWSDPIILTGDLNSDASGCTTETYPNLIDDGFVDAWTLGPPLGAGLTANQADDLQNETSELFHRIDFILYRDEVTAENGPFRGSSQAERVGEESADRIASSATGPTVMLWPSDHAGVVAELRIAPGIGN